MKKIYFLSLILSCIPKHTLPLSKTSDISSNHPKTLVLSDHIYEEQIKTVLLYPSYGSPNDVMLPAVIPMNQWNLVLEFDDLIDQRDSYFARIIHCNRDWSQSLLRDLDFMNDFNEIPINTFEFSVDTHLPYTHYRFNVPPVKLSGNYVLMVFRGSDREDVILTRRFMVYSSDISFSRDESLLGPGRTRMNQQINFAINYSKIDIVNPLTDVYVTIRQNQRWDNLATEIKPSFIRESQRELEYNFFDPEKMLKGGNEFRFFDLRSMNSPGRNIERIDKTVRPHEVYVFRDKSRLNESYSQYRDINGAYLISNLDYKEPGTSNYAYINFELLHASPINGSVYLVGGFNFWELSDQNKMTYDAAAGLYRGSFLLKQGWYDYQYTVKSKDVPPYYFEGSHFETENRYEIFVYYRSMKQRVDLLVGYVELHENQR